MHLFNFKFSSPAGTSESPSGGNKGALLQLFDKKIQKKMCLGNRVSNAGILIPEQNSKSYK